MPMNPKNVPKQNTKYGIFLNAVKSRKSRRSVAADVLSRIPSIGIIIVANDTKAIVRVAHPKPMRGSTWRKMIGYKMPPEKASVPE